MNDRVILQFSTSLEWQSAIIRRICNSRFSHVDFVLDDGSLLGASDNPHAPTLAGNARGVAIRPPDYQPFGIRRRITVFTPKADGIYECALSQLGKPFDGDALHSFLSGVSTAAWHEDDKWFCSELAAWAFWTNEFWSYQLAVQLGRISPHDLKLLLNPYFDVAELDHPIEGIQLGAHEI